MSTIDQIFSAAEAAAAAPAAKPAPAAKRPVGRPPKAKGLLAKRRELAANARAAKSKKSDSKKSVAKKAVRKKPLQAKSKRLAKKTAAKRPVGRPPGSKTAKKGASAKPSKALAEVRIVQGYVTPAAKIEALAGVAKAVGILMQFGIKECLRQRLPASVILVAVGETAGLVASMMGIPYNQAVRAALSGIQGAYKGKPTGSLVDQARLLPSGSRS